MTGNAVKRALAAGGPALGSMVFEFFTPGIARICANAGAEFVMYCIYSAFDEITRGFSDPERRALFHDNAVRIYRMGDA